MGPLFLNKIAGSILATFLLVFGLNELAHVIYHPHELDEPAYKIEVPESADSGGVEAAVFDLGAALRDASAAVGERSAAKCQSCHTFDQGGAAGTGPNLYGVVGRPSASVAGFGYSAAMRDWGGVWTYEALDGFLKNPSGYINGTAMTFVGLRKDDERAAMIAYLRQQTDNPPDYPAPLEIAAPEAEAAEPDDSDGGGEAVADGDPDEG